MSDDPRGLGDRTPEHSDAEKAFLKDFEQAIASYAQAVEAGKAEEAQAAALEALALAADKAERHPTPGSVLGEEAAECKRKRDWVGAEAAYRKLLLLEEVTGTHALRAKAQMDLSGLLRLMGRLEEASQIAALATAAARQADMFPLLVTTLENEISCALARREPRTALAAAIEMVQVIEPRKLYDSMRARALTAYARCLVATGEVAEAESRLAASWELLQGPDTGLNLFAPIFALANWWEVKSQVLEQRGNIEKAREALARCIDYRRRNDGPHAVFRLIRALERSAELSQRAGDLAQAEQAVAEAKSLREGLRLPACRD